MWMESSLTGRTLAYKNGTPAQSRTENLTLEESCDNPFHHGSNKFFNKKEQSAERLDLN
jgi:hypothetical protein